MLDAGHGGADAGAICVEPGPLEGLREKDVVLRYGLALGKALKQAGFEVRYTRQDDSFVTLSRRAEMVNEWGADLLLSLHCNSASSLSAIGFEVFTSKGQTASDPIATSIFNVWSEEWPNRNARVDFTDGDPDKEAGFVVLTKTTKAAVLLEIEFIHNQKGAAWLEDGRNLPRFVLATTEALKKHGPGPTIAEEPPVNYQELYEDLREDLTNLLAAYRAKDGKGLSGVV